MRALSYHIPEGQLSLTKATETCCEDIPIRQENGSHGSRTIVCPLPLL